uniref:Uncharacterized protein LOC114342335 n=1 Tax=Diabrotica virgifera virgifera TaxID=50390 RepID=A0A6P7GS98_DIAVI
MEFNKLIQWNINGYFNNLPMLQIILSEQNPDFVCLQETNFKPNQNIILRNYVCHNQIRLNQNIASGGVSILINNSYDSIRIPLNTNLEAIAVTVIGKTNINICNIYLPPGAVISRNELEDLFKQIPTL